jgi:acetamidase/formamidase
MHTLTASQATQPIQSGEGVAVDVAYVPASPNTVIWGRLPSRSDTPVASIADGETFVIDTVSHEGVMPDQGSDPVAFFGRSGIAVADILTDTVAIARSVIRAETDGPHIVTGPVAIRGAKAGDLLAIRIDALEMRTPYGVISTRHGRGVLAGAGDVDGNYNAVCTVEPEGDGHVGVIALAPGSSEIVRFPIAPFLGMMGVAADSAARPHSTPPGLYGGNIDVKLLTPGSTLFLPVQVDDALFYVGDPHYAQGNGEVALTALEAPLRATLTVDIIPAESLADIAAVEGPFAAGHGMIVPTGLSESLDLAMRRCTANALELVVALFGMDRHLAYLYLSAAADFSVSQAVDIVKGVHGAVRIADFPSVRDTSLARRILEAAK